MTLLPQSNSMHLAGNLAVLDGYHCTRKGLFHLLAPGRKKNVRIVIYVIQILQLENLDLKSC